MTAFIGSLLLGMSLLAPVGLHAAQGSCVVPEAKSTRYPDGRPSAAYRLEAKDHGVILKHGDGPGKCDMLGARDVWVYEDKGTYYMHYDGAGPKGWLCCLATSTNLVDWAKKGPVLDFGKTGEEDSASASYGVTYFDGTSWHMYYLGTPHVSPAPDLIPSFPYLTMKAKGSSAAGPWTKQPEVVPFRIKPGTYYSATASPGHIIKQGDDYLMFFSASTHNPTLRTLSIARTRDLNGRWTVDATPIVPLAEQIENSSLYFEPANQTWFLFTNHIGLEGGEYTDAVWVYWTKDLNIWNAADKAVVLDGRNCAWSRKCIGLPSVLKVGNRLAIIYDGPGGASKSHMKRDVGLAWLDLPLIPPASPVTPSSLKCEQLIHPLGVDVTAPRLGWQLATGNRDWKQTAYRILVATSAERLAKDEGDLWDSGSVKSGDSHGIVYGGTTLKSRMRCFWKVKAWDGQGNASAWSQPAEWGMGILSESEWKGQWIQSDLALFEYQTELKKIPDHNMEDEEIIRGAREKYIRKSSKEVVEAPAVWLRKAFAIGERKVSRATLTISGLGLYEAYVNGRKINDHLLNVSPYDFGKSVPYQVHDVTALIQKGTNGIGVILGNGYFNPVVPSLLREYAADFIDTPRLRCELALEYDDGSTELIPSDLTWQFTTSGPIRFNSIRAGETYDARKELGDWSQGSYQAEAWLPARAANGPSGRLRKQALPPVRCIKEIPAVRVVPQKGGYRFDIGVECTGWARIKVRGKAGQKIIISYPGAGSHTLGRYQTCEYICKGEGEEVYEPRFAFNGYQFIDVQGLDYMPKPSDLVGCQVVSDLKSVGTFACSDERLNRLHEVNLRTLLNYYVQMPMDPVREKVCWTQDAQTCFENSAYNFDVEAIYAKWQEDFVDAILPNGYVPTVVPSCFDGPTINGPWWGGMIIYHPWQHYQFYGDKTILSKSYGAMKSQFAYLSSHATNNVISWGLGDWMDVASGGNGRPKGTTVPFTSTCAYLMFADILQNTATLLGATDDAALYAKRVMEIRETINKKFYDPKTGTYDKGSQTSFILALKLNMMPQAERTKLVQKFAERIAQDKDHLSTGFVGTPFLLTFLNEEGLGDLAWKIATQDTYPSWFGMVFKNNLSVFRENWQGGLVQMPSLAGPIGAWFYRSLGGIRPGKPGFKEVIIEPYTKTMEWVNCSLEGPYGPIVVNWKKANGTLEMKLSIPANTTATVYLPATSLDSITEGGQTLDKAPGIALVRKEAERAVLRVASGQYTFGSRVTK